MSDDDNIVGYTVKELLAELRDEMRTLAGLLASKADVSEVAAVKRELASVKKDHDDRLTKVESEQAYEARHRGAIKDWKRWAIPIALTIVWIAVAILPYLVKSK